METQNLQNESVENKSTPAQDAEAPQQQQTPSEPKRYKLKLGEQEEEIPEAELAELVKAGRDATLTLKEAQELKHILQQLKENPRKTLGDPKLGVDLYKLAEETLLEKIQQEMLTPEQRKIQDYERKFKEIEEKEKGEKEQKEKVLLAEAEAHWMQEYDKLFQHALTSSGLPKTPRTIKRMAEVAAVKLEKGEEIDAKTLASIIKEDALSEIKDLLTSADENTLLQILGDEIGNKIRTAELKKLKSLASARNVPAIRNSDPARQKQPKINTAEWRERLERIKSGLE